MGKFNDYNKAGGFRSYNYVHRERIIVGDLSGEVLSKYNEKVSHTGLPEYSNTARIYFWRARDGRIIQMRIFVDRKAAFDFDWGHTHGKFEKGVVHVHAWKLDAKGQPHRQEPHRILNIEEIKKYGALLRKADPHIRFH